MKNVLKLIFMFIAVAMIAVIAIWMWDNFRDKTNPEKLAEIIHIEDTRNYDSALESYLSDHELTVRSRAALAIGRIGAEGAGKILFDLVYDEALSVASTAAFAIGLTDEKEYAGKLAAVAYDMPAVICAQAVASIGRLADSSMTDVINDLAGFLTHPSPEVREETWMAFFRAKAKDKVKDNLVFLSNEPDEQVKIRGMYALARMKIAEAESIYESFVDSDDPDVRSLAVRGLGSVDSKSALRYLRMALNDSNPRVVAQAITELGRKKDKDSKQTLARKFNREEDEKLLLAIMAAMRTQENDQGLDRAYQLIVPEQTVNVVGTAAGYIAHFKRGRAVALIDSLAAVENVRIKIYAASAYGDVGRENVVKRLSKMFGDQDASVRAAVFSALALVDSSDFEYFIDEALNDRDMVVRVLAIDQIQERKLTGYLERLLAFGTQEEMVDTDTRRSLVSAAQAFLTENKDDSLAKKLLINGTLDKDYIVRINAISAYEEIFGYKNSGMVGQTTTRISEGRIESGFSNNKINPIAIIETDKGEIVLELLYDIAPLTVLNFIDLSEDGFYDKKIFHRVIPNFVAQGGCPRGDGWGGPGYSIRCEYTNQPYLRGTVGIATSGKDTGGSQFFITHSPQPHLEGRYTIFAQVITGMEVVDQIVRGDLINKIEIEEE